MKDTYYVTTSIPYVNAAPHIGHALEFAQADAIARYHRQQGRDVRLLTGTDDNSLKNVLAAEREGVPTQVLVDRYARAFADLALAIDLSHDDFIRTSADPRHLLGVRTLWETLERRGDVYKKSYRGLYCVGCEQFYDVHELEDGRCPEHGTAPDVVEEENYFFRLSHYQDQLAELIESGRLRIVPEARRNEVRAFIGRGLEDFSISRSRARARGWGIEVPGNASQVMYVWFDALANYITALGYGSGDAAGPLYGRYWVDNPRRLHVIGKGILRFHAVYWPAMLLSAGEPLPTSLLVHGYLTIGGQKISKSLGNVVDPLALVERYGADALRYWLLRAVPATADADYTDEKLERRYTAELANDFGNLVQRATSLVQRYAHGAVPQPGLLTEAEERLLTEARALSGRVTAAFGRTSPDGALDAVVSFVGAANRYAEETAAWHLAKDPSAGERLRTALYHLAEAARLVSWHLWPFIPRAAEEAHRRLAGESPRPGQGTFGLLQPGTPVSTGAPLFPRVGTAAALAAVAR